MENPAFRRRADQGILFTSAKCPPGPGLDNSCELPFGFVWTPMAPSSNGISVVECRGEALPPVICLSCLAYLNLYADVDLSTGIWTCPLCGEKNVIPKEDISGSLSSVLASSVVEYHQKAGPDNPEEDALDSCTYVLVVDANLPRDEAKAVASAMQSFFADFSIQRPYSKLNLGLVVFDKVVAMYQLGLSGLASADVYTPVEANDEETLANRKSTMEQRSYLTEVEPGDDLSSLWRCFWAVFGVSVEAEGKTNLKESVDEKPLSRTEMLRRKKEERLRKQQVTNGAYNPITVESPWVANRRRKKAGHPMRCTGEAIQCAIDMTGVGQPYPSRTARILLFTNGCPNLGDGSVVAVSTHQRPPASRNRPTPDKVDAVELHRAVQYFDMTANFALENGVGIDVFCTGMKTVTIGSDSSFLYEF